MPLVRIDIPQNRSREYRDALSQSVYRIMVEVLKVPQDDRFQVISEHAFGELIIDPHYLGIERSSDAIIVQITLNEGRALVQKRAFYAALASELEACIALRPSDLMISLVEVKKENWSFGNGEAQYT